MYPSVPSNFIFILFFYLDFRPPNILLLKLIFFRSSKERFRDQDLASRDRDRKDKKRSYESANGRSEDRRSSEEREAGEI